MLVVDQFLLSWIFNNYPAKSRGILLDTLPWRPTSFRKIKHGNCFIIQQIVNETDFASKNTVFVQRFAIRFQSNLGNPVYRRISVMYG